MIFFQFLICSLHAIHLTVLLHGIDANGNKLTQYTKAVKDKFGSQIHAINPTYKTFEGIGKASDDVLRAINDEVQKQEISSISFISHSFGGLVAKAVVEKLKYSHPNVQIKNFVTLATPHLGSRHLLTRIELFRKMGSAIVRKMFPPSHRELLQVDESGILQKLSDPEILKDVQNLHNYANVAGDGIVAHYTSAISGKSLSRLKSIVSTTVEPFKGTREPIGLIDKDEIELLSKQQNLNWNTWDYYDPKSKDTHEGIIKSDVVIANILDNFAI